jgi:Flp pilus assembly protein TadG
MRWLSVMRMAQLLRSNVDRQLGRNGRDSETGAVAALVAIFFGFGVLLGLGALVLDTGSLLFERRQLQSGADAAALSIAQTCADRDGTASPCTDADFSPSTVEGLASANAADGKSAIAGVCGSAALVQALKKANPNATLATCPTPWVQDPGTPTIPPNNPGLVECPATPSNAKYVEVRTSTLTVDGKTILPPILAQALVGGSSGETVKACARAGWGPVGTSTNAFPLVVGVCGWDQATKGGTHFATAPSPQYSPAPNQNANGTGTSSLPSALLVPADTLTAITVHTSSGTNGVYKCDAQTAGKYYPGGFGWTQTTGSGCSANFTDTGNVTGSNGAAAPSGCKQGGIVPYVGTVVLIPIFKEVVGSTYVIDGLASFYLAGYANVPAGGPKSMDGYKSSLFPVCDEGSNTTCLYGWFTAPLVDVGSISDSGGTPRGPFVVQVLG